MVNINTIYIHGVNWRYMADELEVMTRRMQRCELEQTGLQYSPMAHFRSESEELSCTLI